MRRRLLWVLFLALVAAAGQAFAQAERGSPVLSSRVRGEDGAPMALVPGGPFVIGPEITVLPGAPPPRLPAGFELRRIAADRYQVLHRLGTFYIDVYEVTNGRYGRFVRESGRRAPAFADDPRFNGPNHPVVGVSWFDAEAYCRWAKKRLPTEAEWEKAARGPDGYDATQVPAHGEAPPRKPWANYRPIVPIGFDYYHADANADGFRYTAPVGSFPDEGGTYGVYDLAGNVWEWVADMYPWGRASQTVNLVGHEDARGADPARLQGVKVQRGGSWLNLLDKLSPVYRRWSDPALAGDSAAGFRCARDP